MSANTITNDDLMVVIKAHLKKNGLLSHHLKSFNRMVTEMNDEIKQIIQIDLPSGEYNIAIKLKDNNSKLSLKLTEIEKNYDSVINENTLLKKDLKDVKASIPILFKPCHISP